MTGLFPDIPDKPKRRRRPFIPPTVEDVRMYAVKRGMPDFDAQKFLDYYRASDPPWHDQQGKPVRSWKQKMIAIWEPQYWQKKQAQANGAKPKKTKLFPIPGRVCSKPGCKMPAVYKDGSGGYDFYYCADHMPAKVKERYE